MAYREIPEGSIEIQTGLYAEQRRLTIGNTVYIGYNLYSAEGYCFYCLNVPENFDDEGNLKPPNERIYATFMASAYRTIEAINADIVSVPVEEGYEIVSVPNTPTVTE